MGDYISEGNSIFKLSLRENLVPFGRAVRMTVSLMILVGLTSLIGRVMWPTRAESWDTNSVKLHLQSWLMALIVIIMKFKQL